MTYDTTIIEANPYLMVLNNMWEHGIYSVVKIAERGTIFKIPCPDIEIKIILKETIKI